MKRIYFRVLILLLLLTLLACRPQDETKPPPPPPQGVADLIRFNQKLSSYVRDETPLLSPALQKDFDATFNRKFFAPWHLKKASISSDKAFWGISHYEGKDGFTENLRPWQHDEWQRLVILQQIALYPSLARPAITVRNSSLRLLPTERPFFLDPQLPGEGFPFDYFQLSAIAIGNPVFATHRSSDGAWTFVESNFAYGWIASNDIAWITPPLQRRYENGQYAAILGEDTSLRNSRGDYLGQADLGTIFPIVRSKGTDTHLYIPVRNADGNAELRTAVLSSTQAAQKPLELTPAVIARLVDPLMGQHYGWGGLFGNRDCSSSMRDIFAPFGIWLGRNSAEQGQKGGEFHDLRDKSAAEKEAKIIASGVPFATLIWLKGHIGLYLGKGDENEEPLLLHNFWGVHIFDEKGREGREIVGRLVITSMRPGEERPDVPKDNFYKRVQGMVILTRER